MSQKTRKATTLELHACNYLNDLRESGVTNMFGAVPFIQQKFNLDRKESTRILSVWMTNFNEESEYENITDE
jgi:hypothetical protein